MADKIEIKDLDGAIATVSNNWVTAGKRNGLDVRRKFKGLSTCVDIDNKVTECIIYYFEQELYPNHTEEVPSISKTECKSYTLKNIGKRMEVQTTFATDEDSQDVVTETQIRDAINTLNTYINELGQQGIVNPVNSTLGDLTKLPLNVSTPYTLNSN